MPQRSTLIGMPYGNLSKIHKFVCQKAAKISESKGSAELPVWRLATRDGLKIRAAQDHSGLTCVMEETRSWRKAVVELWLTRPASQRTARHISSLLVPTEKLANRIQVRHAFAHGIHRHDNRYAKEQSPYSPKPTPEKQRNEYCHRVEMSDPLHQPRHD